ncbi:MAG TPA: VWA domain-containing protein, partial [Thermoanaerobaculia bacterium]|nr:VWA domain-containing protein [Thermoanaerobaculia bacterium]
MRLPKSFVAVPLAFFVWPLAARAGDKPKQEQADTTVREEARVTVVEVPVNVVDSKGRPVENLKAEDFQVFDDGKKQEITGFEIIDQRQPLPEPAADEPPVNPAARRHFVLVFDLTFSSPHGISNAKKAARDFVVTRMKELDEAAIVTYQVERGMRLLMSFTSDRTQLAAAVDSIGFPLLASRAADPLGFVLVRPSFSNDSGFFNVNYLGPRGAGNDAVMDEALENMQVLNSRNLRQTYRTNVLRFIDAFGKMARALDAVQGRKHILFLSEGFDSRELSGSEFAGAQQSDWIIHGESWKFDSDSRWGNSQLRRSMDKDLALFNRSDCIIHSIDIAGLRATSDITGGADQVINGEDSLFYVAEETGGQFLHNSNDLGDSFEKLLDRTGLIYVLAFQPVRVPENGKFHELKVTVKNKSWNVSARSGYYEPKSEKTLSPIERKLALSSAIASALPRTDVPSWVLAAPVPAEQGPARVSVVVEVPGDRLLNGHTDSKMDVDLFVYAIDGKGQTADYLYQPVSVDLKVAAENLSRNGLKYYGQLNLPPGDYTLRTLVRDNQTGRYGVSITPVKVPQASSPTALPPLFVDEGKNWILVKAKSLHKPEDPGEYPFAMSGQSFVPSALADMKNGMKSRVCVIAYNFPADGSQLEYSARAIGVD